jgi:hypothetical protein
MTIGNCKHFWQNYELKTDNSRHVPVHPENGFIYLPVATCKAPLERIFSHIDASMR